MKKLTCTLSALVALLLVIPAASADAPAQMPLSGVLRDNAGTPVSAGAFEVEFTLYADAEGKSPVWSESWVAPDADDCDSAPGSCLTVSGGVFRLMLGSINPLQASIFAQSAGLWLGMTVETDPELPLRPLGSTAWAMHASSAAGLDCSGCVDPDALSQATLETIQDEVLATLLQWGAAAVPFDDATAEVGADDMQGAIEKLKELIDATPGGGGAGNVNEGAGQLIAYPQDRSVPAYGSARQYVHLIQPSTPKVVAHVYGEQSANFGGSDNLVVAFDFAPNQYSAGAVGTAGDTSLQVLNPSLFNTGSHILVHQTIGGDGTTSGTWEINQVLAVNGTSLQLLQPLESSFVSNDTVKAQVVLAASFGQLEVVSGGTVRAAEPLAPDGSRGGIVYVRANKVTVKAGGAITVDGVGFAGGKLGPPAQAGASECGVAAAGDNEDPNCSGGGRPLHGCGNAGGGGNQSAGDDGQQHAGCTGPGQGGEAKGDSDAATLQFGGGGGGAHGADGGDGGGIVVLGAQTLIVQEGGQVSANGLPAQGIGAGGGAGGSVVVYTDQAQVEGTLEAAGGVGTAGRNWAYTGSPEYQGTVGFNSYSHGGGYSPKNKEFWYPNWSGSTVYRFNESFSQIGSFNAGTSDMMQLWGTTEGPFYTANWGQDRIRKMSETGSPQLWEAALGSTTGGVCTDGLRVFAMRSGGATVYTFDPDTGESLGNFSYAGNTSNINGGLMCTPGRLWRLDTNQQGDVMDLTTGEIIHTWSLNETPNNASFDGTDIYLSANDSSSQRWRIIQGDVYDPPSEATPGGDGGAGWVIELPPVQGVVNESYPKGVQLWVDGVDITGTIGDPNGRGLPDWDGEANAWGASGLDPWSTGPLDLSTAVNWTLGEHIIELKETGGAGGQLKSYVYVIYPFTESTPPANDTCSTPLSLDPEAAPVVISGTTEDTMGKTKASDDSVQVACGGLGGLDVVYRLDLSQRSLLHGAIVAPFSTKMYIRAGDCETGDPVICADKDFTTAPLEAGTYFLFVDSDSPLAKGDFTLALSTTPAPIPDHDTCDAATSLIFGAQGVATVSSSTLYAQDDVQGLCSAANSGGPDVLYTFTAGTGEGVDVTVDADFDTVVFLMTQGCGDAGFPLACSSTGVLSVQGLAGGQYWLAVDGTQPLQWGDFDMTVSVK